MTRNLKLLIIGLIVNITLDYLRKVMHPLYLQIYYPKELIHTKLTTQKTSLHFKAEQKLLSFPSSHGLLLNGINLI